MSLPWLPQPLQEHQHLVAFGCILLSTALLEPKYSAGGMKIWKREELIATPIQYMTPQVKQAARSNTVP